jgi:hypothetical protein
MCIERNWLFEDAVGKMESGEWRMGRIGFSKMFGRNREWEELDFPRCFRENGE